MPLVIFQRQLVNEFDRHLDFGHAVNIFDLVDIVDAAQHLPFRRTLHRGALKMHRDNPRGGGARPHTSI